MQEQFYGGYTMTNTTIEFIRVDSFLDDINRDGCFDTQDMDGISPNYRVVLASDCSNDIERCIDADGTLIVPYDAEKDTGVNVLDTIGEEDGFCSMMWSKGVNGERTMSVSDSSVSYSFGDISATIKGFFLCNVGSGSGYVIAYSILDKPIEENGSMICPCDGMIWSIRYGA